MHGVHDGTTHIGQRTAGPRGPCEAPSRSSRTRVRDGRVVASSGCLSVHLVCGAYADLLHTSSVEDWPEGHDGWGCGTLERLDFFVYCRGMRQSLVAPPVCALGGMLRRGAPLICPAHVQAWRGFWMPSFWAREQARFCGSRAVGRTDAPPPHSGLYCPSLSPILLVQSIDFAAMPRCAGIL
jgi:hypothetical protein